MVPREFIKYLFYFFVEPVLYIINFIFSWGRIQSTVNPRYNLD
jgi:hypothetical protein